MRSRAETPLESSATLADLEHWMQSRIVAPHESSVPLGQLQARSKDWLESSATLAPDERVALYANMYVWRMHDALAEDFPALRVMCGAERFAKLARDYLARFPSRHASLNELGANLPLFLETARLPRRALLHDIAQLELGIARSTLAANVEPVSRERIAGIAPEAWNDACFEFAPHVRLFEFEYRANEIVTAARRGDTLPSVAKRATSVVVWRKDWIVWRKDLLPGPFAALSALTKGKSLGAATRAARRAHGGDRAALDHALQHAWGEWLAEGFFTRITTAKR